MQTLLSIRGIGEISANVAADNDAGHGVAEGLASQPVLFLLGVLTLIISLVSLSILAILVLSGTSFLLSGVVEMVVVRTASLLDALDGYDSHVFKSVTVLFFAGISGDSSEWGP